MIRRASTRALLAVATVATAAVLAATATAFWTGGGSGSAQTQLGTPAALSLSAGTPSTLIRPGSAAGVATIATNPNLYPVRIGSLLLDTSAGSGGFDVDAGHSACNLASLAFTAQHAGWTIPAHTGAGDGSLAIELSSALTMDATAANACQGATFTVHLVAGA